MTFKDLENAIPFETVLVNECGNERFFVVINPINNILIACHKEGDAFTNWEEEEIKNWKIKKTTKKVKVEAWINIYPYGYCRTYHTRENAEKYSKGRIACEHFCKEYEVEVE